MKRRFNLVEYRVSFPCVNRTTLCYYQEPFLLTILLSSLGLSWGMYVRCSLEHVPLYILAIDHCTMRHDLHDDKQPYGNITQY